MSISHQSAGEMPSSGPRSLVVVAGRVGSAGSGGGTASVVTWLSVYAARTPGTLARDNVTVILSDDCEPQPDATPQPPSKRHFALEVDDLAAARGAVTAGGAPIEKEEPGVRFWTRDPAGNRIEIAQGR